MNVNLLEISTKDWMQKAADMRVIRDLHRRLIISGPTRISARLARLHMETQDTEVNTKIPVKSKSVMNLDTDIEEVDEVLQLK